MQKLIVFNNVTDGYFAGANGDFSWMFDGIKEKLNLKLTKTRTFRNWKVFLCYQPIA